MVDNSNIEIGIDMLSMMSDDELETNITAFFDTISRRSSKGKETRREEETVCYLQREWQQRALRRQAHRNYVQNAEQEECELQMYEDTLPEYKPVPPPAWLVELFGWY